MEPELRVSSSELGGEWNIVTVWSRIIYTLVGIAGLWCITLLFREDDVE